MKVSCQSCGASYAIADDKVSGRVVKVRCKTCRTAIVVDGRQAQSGPPAPPRGVRVDADREQGSRQSHAPSGRPQPRTGPAAATSSTASNVWTVNLSETDSRSMTPDEIVKAYARGELHEAFVWKDGMSDWKPLLEVPELASLIQGKAPSVPPPPAQLVGKPQTAPGATAYTDAGKPAARAANARGEAQDLFGAVDKAGSEEEARRAQAAEPSAQPKLTGARNENSVLFSLDALKAGMLGGSPNPSSSSTQATTKPATPLSFKPPGPPPTRNRERERKLDDVLNIGGAGLMFSLGGDQSALLTAPAPPEPKADAKAKKKDKGKAPAPGNDAAAAAAASAAPAAATVPGTVPPGAEPGAAMPVPAIAPGPPGTTPPVQGGVPVQAGAVPANPVLSSVPAPQNLMKLVIVIASAFGVLAVAGVVIAFVLGRRTGVEELARTEVPGAAAPASPGRPELGLPGAAQPAVAQQLPAQLGAQSPPAQVQQVPPGQLAAQPAVVQQPAAVAPPGLQAPALQPPAPAQPASPPAPANVGRNVAPVSAPARPVSEEKQHIADFLKRKVEEEKPAREATKEPAREPVKEKEKEEEKEKEAPAPKGPSAGGGGTFDKNAAVAALTQASGAAAACKRPDGPTGTGRVTVTFAPSGRATNAVVSGGSFAGTSVGGCVASVFRRARVPAFTGDAVTVSKSFTIN